MTDAYKFAMAQAGEPMRPETFYLSFRRPGSYLIPFDMRKVVKALCPSIPTRSEQRFLARHGYALDVEMLQALAGHVETWAPPRGAWVREGEPILRITGPSFLVSWLEAMVIWLHYPIQVATEAVLHGRRSFACTCEDEAEITRLAVEAAGIQDELHVEVDTPAYARVVRANAQKLAKDLDGTLARVFEVGMRGASCMQMHRIALEEIRELHVAGSSNLHLARELDLLPVGTTGHEHQLRYGDDKVAFRAVRDRRAGSPSYLFDTFDALQLGIPAAIEVLREKPEIRASVRFDSGDTRAQLEAFAAAGVDPTYIFMDGINPAKVRDLCELQRELVPEARPFLFGVGGYLVGRAAPSPLTRDRVSAVYKLCDSGGRPVMKFSVPGKESVPGRPVSWRRPGADGVQSIIGQQWEEPACGAERIELAFPSSDLLPPIFSSATRRFIDELRARHLGTNEVFTRPDSTKLATKGTES
jgi:nicotinic acid phosphoribosyltransferase